MIEHSSLLLFPYNKIILSRELFSEEPSLWKSSIRSESGDIQLQTPEYQLHLDVWRLHVPGLRQWLTFRNGGLSIFLFFTLLTLRHIISRGYDNFKQALHHHITIQARMRVRLPYCLPRSLLFPRSPPHALPHLLLVTC